jgi:hypothetical protein
MRRGRRREEKRETVRPEEDQPIQPPFPAVFLSILQKAVGSRRRRLMICVLESETLLCTEKRANAMETPNGEGEWKNNLAKKVRPAAALRRVHAIRKQCML